MKKLFLMLMAFTVFCAFSAHDTVDAKRGGFKAPRKSYTQTPSKSADSVKRSDSGAKAPGNGTAAGAAQNRGFTSGFGGGGFLKGMMIGGLAGMLFGSMFAGMGGFGNLLGLLVNVLAIYFLFVIIRAVIGHFRARKRYDHNGRPY